MRQHKENHVFKCTKCQKEFSCRSSLGRHQDIHSNKRPYVCNDCGFAFRQACHLKDHIKNKRCSRTHMIGDNYKCNQCNKTFKTQGFFRKHMEYHNVSGLFKCTRCKKKFIGEKYLRQHVLLKHDGNQEYACQFCPSIFKTASELKSHVTEHKPKQCHLCDMSFDTDLHLCVHVLKDHKSEAHIKRSMAHIQSDERNASNSKSDTQTSNFDVHTSKIGSSSGDINSQEPAASLPTSDASSKESLVVLEIDTHGPIPKRSSRKRKAPDYFGKSSNLSDIDFETVQLDALIDTQCSESIAYSHNEAVQPEKTESSKGMYQCDFCNKLFESPIGLYAHSYTHRGLEENEKYNCPSCDKIYTTFNSFSNHIKIHEVDGEYYCKLCNKQFSTHYSLKRHELAHTGVRPYLCSKCNRSFTQKGHLTSHLRLHYTGELPFKCNKCSMNFSSNMMLARHVTTDHEDTNEIGKFKCNLCDRSFKVKSELIAHKREHKNYPYSCETCGRGFKWLDSLNGHRILHERGLGMRPGLSSQGYACETCGKSFIRPDLLGRHRLTHSGEKPFKCPVCLKAFRQSGHVTEHLRRHSTERPFKCDICDKAFYRRKDLRAHKNRVHGIDPSKTPPPRQQLRSKASSALDTNELEPITAGRNKPVSLATPESQHEILPSISTAELDTSLHQISDSSLSTSTYGTPTTDSPVNRSLFSDGPNSPAIMTPTTDQSSQVSSAINFKLNEEIPCSLNETAPNVFGSNSVSSLQPDKISAATTDALLACNQPVGLQSSSRKDQDDSIVSAEQYEQISFTAMDTTLTKNQNKGFQSLLKKGGLREVARRTQGPFFCQYCNKQLTSAYQVKRHERTHTDERPYECQICNKAFKQLAHLNDHVLRHVSGKPFSCDICGTGFKIPKDLRRHMRTVHSEIDEKNSTVHAKQDCKDEKLGDFKELEGGSNGDDDSKKHNGSEKHCLEQTKKKLGRKPVLCKQNLKCNFCEKEFKGLYEVQRHLLVHTGEKNHVCDLCGNSYKQKCHLKVHMRKQHSDHEQLLQCDFCQDVFSTDKALQHHNNLFHSCLSKEKDNMEPTNDFSTPDVRVSMVDSFISSTPEDPPLEKEGEFMEMNTASQNNPSVPFITSENNPSVSFITSEKYSLDTTDNLLPDNQVDISTFIENLSDDNKA